MVKNQSEPVTPLINFEAFGKSVRKHPPPLPPANDKDKALENSVRQNPPPLPGHDQREPLPQANDTDEVLRALHQLPYEIARQLKLLTWIARADGARLQGYTFGVTVGVLARVGLADEFGVTCTAAVLDPLLKPHQKAAGLAAFHARVQQPDSRFLQYYASGLERAQQTT